VANLRTCRKRISGDGSVRSGDVSGPEIDSLVLYTAASRSSTTNDPRPGRGGRAWRIARGSRVWFIRSAVASSGVDRSKG
jgi:hypothetical protein